MSIDFRFEYERILIQRGTMKWWTELTGVGIKTCILDAAAPYWWSAAGTQRTDEGEKQ